MQEEEKIGSEKMAFVLRTCIGRGTENASLANCSNVLHPTMFWGKSKINQSMACSCKTHEEVCADVVTPVEILFFFKITD